MTLRRGGTCQTTKARAKRSASSEKPQVDLRRLPCHRGEQVKGS